MINNLPKISVTLEDDGYQGRGFFSSVNLTLLAIFWCEQNNLVPSVGNTILKLYSHPASSSILRRRPFSSFFGNSYIPANNSSTLLIGDVWNFIIKEIDINREDVILCLSKINKNLLKHMPDSVIQYINLAPSEWPQEYEITVHYRGCDYLRNVPKDHTPNLQAEQFLEKILPIIANKKVFVATDDSNFLNILRRHNLNNNVFAFSDVTRGEPGRGIHHKSRYQRLGLEPIHMPFLRGLQVLRDCTHLSRANHYIGSNSNLAYYSQILNPDIKITNLSATKSF